MTVLYVILGIAALGFLVCIHELGHYWMAVRVGMRVEVFSIGMGASVIKWYRKGVKWQVGWIPFGGYVKIAGMEKEDGKEPYEISDGFFGRPPIDRIKVAIMGPLVNIVFAFLAFTAIWVMGGREKPFSEFTSRLGWVDPISELHKHGVRPGDRITAYDDYPINKSKEHLYAPMLGGDSVKVEGFYANHFDPSRDKPFMYNVEPYLDHGAPEEGMKTLGINLPASYLLLQEDPSILKGPASQSSLQKGDRILWANGNVIFSNQHLRSALNQDDAVVTFMRGAKKNIAKIPLYQLDDYRLTEKQKGELSDWKFAVGDKAEFSNVWFFPYDINPDGVVEGDLELIDHKQERVSEVRSGPIGNLLLPGDKLLSINGMPADSGKEIFSECQVHRSLLIVSRTSELETTPLWGESDTEFEKAFTDPALLESIQHIGEGGTFAKNGYHLIEPIVPIPQLEFEMDLEDKTKLTEEYTQIQNEIAKMPSGDRKKASLKWLDKWKSERVLGVHLNDRTTIYNPAPQFLFNDVLSETWRTLRALVQGSLHPKWMSGPVGIVRVMHYGWSIGLSEALFWMAVISLNLGILNLLPIPVLDGGHICFSLWEMMTKKPLKSRTMELLIIPFVVVLIGFFIFVTYNDIARLFGF